jgi:hypothetical protein
MNPDQALPQPLADQLPEAAASATLLARGSGGRTSCYPWHICQREESILLHTGAIWMAAIHAGTGPAASTVPLNVAAQAATDLPESHLPAGVNAGSVHSIRANPGGSCASDSLYLEGLKGMDRAVAALAAQYEILQLVPCGGERLYALATDSGSPAVQHIFTTGPETGQQWDEVAAPESYAPVSHLASFAQTLYAAVDDDIAGFRLWRLDDSRGVGGWTLVMDRGGEAHACSGRVTAVYTDPEHLLLACAPGAELGQQAQRPIGPELIQVRPDNTWDLIVGTTRLSPQGLVVPKSLMGRGFDTGAARQITSITRCAGVFCVSLEAPAAEGAGLRGEVWNSHDLVTWSRMPLPAEIMALNAVPVSALRQCNTTLLVIMRQPGADSMIADKNLPAQAVPGLPRDIEFWVFQNCA